eukprot:m.275373 g.275373  ORF g.275373 m.275373 type:complete len:518 (-) comp11094_c0_seq3:170-1723(-)
MSAPLRFTKEQVLRRELIQVAPTLANIQGSDTIMFQLPEGIGSWNLSTLTAHLELEIKNGATPPAAFDQSTYTTPGVMAQEMFTSHLFQNIQCALNQEDFSDGDGPQRSFPEAYLKMLRRPAGWFSSAVRPLVAPLGADDRFGAPTASRVLGVEHDIRDGYAYGEFLDSANTAYADAANPAVLGVGGPADVRLDPRKLARRRYLAGSTLAICYKPDCALTRIDGLVPADVQVELNFQKNGNLNHLIQAVTGYTAGAPTVTWKSFILTVTRVVPKAEFSAQLYRPIVARTTRHVYASRVLETPIAGSMAFSPNKVLTGRRPDMVVIAITADAPITSSSFASLDNTGANSANHDGRSISLLGSGRGAAVTSDDGTAGGDRTAPYVSFESFRATWGDEHIPAFGPIRQKDAVQGAAHRYYDLHRLGAQKLGGSGLTFGEFQAHFHIVLDLSKEIQESEDSESGQLDLDFTLAQSGVKGQAPAPNTFRLHTVAIYHGGPAAVMMAEHSASAAGRRDVKRGW